MKIDKIIEAAIKEFSEKGYEKASTAQICQSAGVSKGLLFHHFKTKRGLYLLVYEKILAQLMEKINAITYDDCKTYPDTVIKTADVKLKYYIANPNAYEILLEASYNTTGELKEDLAKIYKKYVDIDEYFSERVFKQYEFREGIDPKKAWEIIMAVSSLIERKIMRELASGQNKKGGRLSVAKLRDISGELFEYLNIIFYGISAQDSQTNEEAGA